jgi:hypothetical protein
MAHSELLLEIVTKALRNLAGNTAVGLAFLQCNTKNYASGFCDYRNPRLIPFPCMCWSQHYHLACLDASDYQ